MSLYSKTWGRRNGNGIIQKILWDRVAPGDYVILAGRRFQISDVKVKRNAGGSVQNRAAWNGRKYG